MNQTRRFVFLSPPPRTRSSGFLGAVFFLPLYKGLDHARTIQMDTIRACSAAELAVSSFLLSYSLIRSSWSGLITSSLLCAATAAAVAIHGGLVAGTFPPLLPTLLDAPEFYREHLLEDGLENGVALAEECGCRKQEILLSLDALRCKARVVGMGNKGERTGGRKESALELCSKKNPKQLTSDTDFASFVCRNT